MISIEDVFVSLRNLGLHGLIVEKRPAGGLDAKREQLILQVQFRVRLTIGVPYSEGKAQETEFIESDIDYFIGVLKTEIDNRHVAVTHEEYALIEETLRNLF